MQVTKKQKVICEKILSEVVFRGPYKIQDSEEHNLCVEMVKQGVLKIIKKKNYGRIDIVASSTNWEGEVLPLVEAIGHTIKITKNTEEGYYEALRQGDDKPYGLIMPSLGLPGGGPGRWACMIRGQLICIQKGLPKAKKFVKACY